MEDQLARTTGTLHVIPSALKINPCVNPVIASEAKQSRGNRRACRPWIASPGRRGSQRRVNILAVGIIQTAPRSPPRRTPPRPPGRLRPLQRSVAGRRGFAPHHSAWPGQLHRPHDRSRAGNVPPGFRRRGSRAHLLRRRQPHVPQAQIDPGALVHRATVACVRRRTEVVSRRGGFGTGHRRGRPFGDRLLTAVGLLAAEPGMRAACGLVSSARRPSAQARGKEA